ncbi:hypothetical protein BH09VER1_BH09VER1_37650 [soil metagenome]
MKTPLLLILALATCLFTAIPASAAPKSPDLKGTWVSEYPVSLHHGFGHSAQTITITEQSDANFRGYREWTSKKFIPGKNATKLTKTKDIVAFAGVVGFDGKTLYLADHGQASFITAKLTGPNTMQIIFVMAGEPAVAYRATFERAK